MQVCAPHLLWYMVPIECLMMKDSTEFEFRSSVIVWKIWKTSSNKDWGGKPGNVISETKRGIVQLHEPTDRRVGVGVDVTFCLWEKKNGGTAVDDVTDDVTVSQSKFCSQSLSALQQISDEFFL